MAEEQESKNKPKATLIKHRKPVESRQEPQAEEKPDKKKVVVVKKKKKKPVPKVVSRENTVDTPVQARAPEAGTPVKDQAEKAPAPRPVKPAPPREAPAGGDRDRTPPRQGPPPSSDRRPPRPPRPDGRTDSRQGQRPPAGRRETTGGYRGSSPSRPAPGAGRGPSTYNRGPGRGPAPGGQRPQGQRPGGFKPDKPEEAAKKQPSKKFYKAKKKPNYQKTKRNDLQEKNFQIKKKQVKRANPVPKEIDIVEVITVSDLAKKMNLKASELISRLMALGVMATINQQIDAETATILAAEFDCKVNIVSLYDETIIESEKDDDSKLKPRPPIVTIMGHVDHGKTKLLDAIRTTDVVTGEFGGITQHIGAYQVDLPEGSIVFLDTPGHEAFTLMRARGAQVTDIVVLVVAANDGVMPQTTEAINHAKEAKVPIIVAINKVDLPEANLDRVKQQLSEYELMPESWGGSTLFAEVSALQKTGIRELLDTILLQAEIMELTANYDCRAEGKIIESKVDHGRGIVSTVIIERGTLRLGDSFVAGVYAGKVRAMFNDKGQRIEEATPATPVEVLGFSGVPNAGSPFQVTESDRMARQVGAKRQELEKQGEARNVKKITLDNLYDSIQEGAVQELKVIIKGDVHGSVEALQTALEKLSTPEIRLSVINAAAGAIIEDDVNFAIASNAIIVGFHVRPTPKALELAENEKIDIRKYNVIYDAVDDIRSAMEGLLAPELREVTIGSADVRDTFKVPKIGVIAGAYITSGKVKRNAHVRVFRDGVQSHTGDISSLKRFKDDAKEVESGYECGIGIDNFFDLKEGDELEFYEVKKVAKKLDSKGKNG